MDGHGRAGGCKRLGPTGQRSKTVERFFRRRRRRLPHRIDDRHAHRHASSLMRIGLVVTGGVDRSGRERVIPALLWLIEALARHHELHVFALYYEDEPCTYPLLGATVHDLGTRQVSRGWRRVVQRQRLRSTLASLPRFDVLHAYWGIPAGWVATSVGRALDLPVIVTANSGEFVADHEIAYGFQRRWIDRRLIRDTMRRATRVTVCTRHMQGLAAKLGFDSTVIPIGVPAALFT